ncbi:MAG: ferrous iron transport protein A [Epsilonproteobacteria bacterium]|nr:ferrous iron transport protein A [Campylobacterota bacterium]
MGRLYDCNKGERLEVVKLHADEALKHRLISFGIMKGSQLEIVELAPRKKTIEIKVEKMRIALRAEEAQMIEVKPV